MQQMMRWLLVGVVAVMMTACGGGGGGELTAIQKIATYAQSGGTAPTVQMYADAGVTGVTEENIDEINAVVAGLNYEDVDTPAEVQGYVNQLGLDITNPIFISSATASVAENQTAAITLQATDTTTVTYSISGTDAASFTVAASSGVVTFTTAPDYEGKASYSFTATATDTAGNSAEQSVTIHILNDLCTDGDEIWHMGTMYCPVASPYSTGKVWLDRNLGASQVCTAYNDTACYGDYYQWGRDADGHEKNTSVSRDASDDILTTNVDDVGHGEFIESNSTYDYDWTKTDDNGSLRSVNWSKTDGSSVCPVGYRVATLDELKAELFVADSAEIQKDSGEKADNSDDRRINAVNSFLKLPSAGVRDSYSASMYGVGEWGDVWASSVDGSNSHNVNFDADDADWNNDNRANGLSVRCLRD
jgi:uncharacterized protein (TIGR02145 family)